MSGLPVRARVGGYAGDALCNALSSVTGAVFEVGIPGSGEIEELKDPLIWRQAFSLADGTLFWLVAGKDIREGVARLVLGRVGEAGNDSVSEEESRSAWTDIAGQAMSGIAQALSADLGLDVFAQDGEQDMGGPDDQAAGAVLEIRSGVETWHVRIAWSGQFADAVASASPQSGQPAFVPQEMASSKTLELLMDVPLPVSVSFGKTLLQIREVLKLNTGSVVELDRLVSDPVEVIVNNCVIARGEVVVVDGNYGVRVTHLASREERLRSGMGEASSRLGTAAK